jgi:tRNA/tmRNA/rRNA uracil-C5-methylase (TrmA/RlmC/RlmD family)
VSEGLVGTILELDVGTPAHGGFCIARHDNTPGGRVVFVRHALPGERVQALVTEDAGGSFVRADAVAVMVASPDRVEPPCPYAGPGRCGGCDWQHATPEAQRRLKQDVVREQFARLAGLAVDPVVEALPGGMLGWRTRVSFAVDSRGRPGLHRHRSHELELVASCPLGVAGVGDGAAPGGRWPGTSGIEAARDDDGAITLLAHLPARRPAGRGRRPPDRVKVVDGPQRHRHRLLGQNYEVDAAGFWQVHPHALETIATALEDVLRLRPGESVLELYAGAGALTAALARAVGSTGLVVGVETSRQAVDDAAANLAELPWAEVRRGRVDAPLVRSLGLSPDVVVLDPPRAGVGRDSMAALLDLEPRAVGYVSCDPATLARDVRVALDAGWRMSALRSFDAFPMTHHVECLALLEPGLKRAERRETPAP